ncbi:MAG TPA: mobile mystery protein B [Candidatus Angelobacter sp.]|nr:mobile mystery protein B [Candidatus Angelobacter sp.]
MTPADSNTPLSPEELADLIPSLATKEELNEWERENILRAREWAIRDRTSPLDMASDAYVRKLHLKMFDQTWKWAGQYRRTEKNIGIPFHQIREHLVALLGDVRYWLQHSTFPPDEIAVRFHHHLVVIHPFPNGNGRHARLIADLFVMKLGRAAFTWGATDLVKPGEARARYLDAVRAADQGDIQPLIKFARS